MTPEQQQQRIMGYFIEEAKDHLQTIENGLLNLQETLEEPDSINELFRAAHSIKGGSAMLGVSSIQHISHRLEDYFKILKEDSNIRVDEKLTSLFLAGFDRLQDLLEHLETNFRISDELSALTISELNPVFSQLEAHLNTLASRQNVGVPITAAPKADKSPIAIFQNEVTAKLRDMLQLFKQSDNLTTRQQLQAICDDLNQFGEQFQLNSWMQLINKAKQAIAANQNTYRTLAPILIKDIKQAQDLVLANRELEVVESPQLQALIPYIPPIGIEEDDEISTIFTAGAVKETDALDLDNLSESEDMSDFAAIHDLSDVTSQAFDESNEFLGNEKLDWLNESDEQDRRHVDGPKVGASEMKSLASLFENEDVDIESAWEDIETSETKISAPDDTQSKSDQDELTDLLNHNKDENLDIDSSDDDLTGLFGNEFAMETPSQQALSDALFPDDPDDMDMGENNTPTNSTDLSLESELFPADLGDEEIATDSLFDGIEGLDDLSSETSQDLQTGLSQVESQVEDDLFSNDFALESSVERETIHQRDEFDLFEGSESLDLVQDLEEDAGLSDLQNQDLDPFGFAEDSVFDLAAESADPSDVMAEPDLISNVIEGDKVEAHEDPFAIADESEPSHDLLVLETPTDLTSESLQTPPVADVQPASIFEDLGFEEEDSLGFTNTTQEDFASLGAAIEQITEQIIETDIFGAEDLEDSTSADLFVSSGTNDDFALEAPVPDRTESQIAEDLGLTDFLIETEEDEASDFLEFTSPGNANQQDRDEDIEALQLESETAEVVEAGVTKIGELFGDGLGESGQASIELGDRFWLGDLQSETTEPDASTPEISNEFDEFLDIDDIPTSDPIADELIESNAEDSNPEDFNAKDLEEIGDSLSDFTDNLDLSAFDASLDPVRDSIARDVEPQESEIGEISEVEMLQDAGESAESPAGSILEGIADLSSFGDVFEHATDLDPNPDLGLDLDFNLSEPLTTTEELGLDDFEVSHEASENPFADPDADAFVASHDAEAEDVVDEDVVDIGLGDFLEQAVGETLDLDFERQEDPLSETSSTPSENHETIETIKVEDEDFGLGDFLTLEPEPQPLQNFDLDDDLQPLVSEDRNELELNRAEDNTFAELISTADTVGSAAKGEETAIVDFFSAPEDESDNALGFKLDDEFNQDAAESTSQEVADLFAENEILDSEPLMAQDPISQDPISQVQSSDRQGTGIEDDLGYDFSEFDRLNDRDSDDPISPDFVHSSFERDSSEEAGSESVSLDVADLDASDDSTDKNEPVGEPEIEPIETSAATDSTLDNLVDFFDFEDSSDMSQIETRDLVRQDSDRVDRLAFGSFDLSDDLPEPAIETSDKPSSGESVEDVMGDMFDDLEAMLGESTEISDPNPLISQPSGSNGSNNDGFDDLEALLGSPSAASTPAPVAQGSDDFGDLEQMLQDTYSKDVGPVITRPKRQAQTTRKPKTTDTMRVDVRHLDSLNNLVGELVVNRNLLEQDQERLQQFINNLLHQVQQLSEVSQRMRDQYDRSLLESSLMAGRSKGQSVSFDDISRELGDDDDSGSNVSEGFEGIEFDRYNTFHILSQEIIELIVRVRESASDIQFVVTETEQVTRQLGTITTQIQDDLKQSRMVPFAQIADRMPRGVRERSIKSGKQAELEVFGRETLIDKAILEQLTDPLTHLVNNAIDHGLEDPGTRQSSSKVAMGKITIRAYHQGNQTVISIGDDGAGINPDRVKKSAVSKGVRTQSEVAGLSDNEVYDLLFEAGFSTKTKADEFSGRGVGLDVVKSSLDDIRGSMYIESAIGKGTTFTIRLPLTLSISKAMFCISDRARIAFPVDGFEDMIEVPQSQIQLNSKGQPCLPWRDTILPFQHLSNLLAYNRHISRSSIYGKQDNDEVCIIILRNEGNYLALQVDQFLGEYEIVIKQLEGPIPKPVGIAGATVLGDGRVMAIANVLELFDIASGRLRPSVSSTPVLPPDNEFVADPTVLIVDDSITVRELLSLTFAKVGYRVEQARDGQDAWDKLRAGLPCDLIFCDIEMPRMDGLDLLSRLQKEPELSKIPVAMLTSRGADRHRQTAIQLGAKGYFTKPYLEEELLSASQRMLKGEVLVSL
jgi:chemotaxis protein histidine kinase CheA/ActR/RegA family two-component response regulator